MHRTTYVVTAAVVAWLVVAPRQAEAENVYGVCFANRKRVECNAGDDAEKTVEHVRKQCRYWSEKPCAEVATCSTHGYFVTATSRTDGEHAVRCGVPKASRDDAMEFVRLACGGDCLIMTYWIGPPPGPDPAEEKQREEAERRATEQARLEKERQDRERLEVERKEKAREDKERLDNEREDRERLEKARVEKQRAETAGREQEQAERKRQAQQRADEVRRERARIDAEREAERQRVIARGFQLQREAHATNDKLGQTSGTVAGSVFAVEGGNAGTEETTRALRAGFGFGGRFLPVMTNTDGGNVVEESTQSTGGGFAFEGRLELWPRYRQRWGVGPSIEAGVAGMALPGGGMYAVHAGVGANAYFGNRAGWSIEGEFGLHGQIVGSSGLYVDATITGSGSYRIWRLGAGPSWCVTPTPGVGGFCDTKLYARLLLDWTSAATTTTRIGGMMFGGSTGGGSAKVLRLGVASKRAPFGVGLELELGTDYPAPGETRFALESGEDRTGVYFAFLMRKNWTWHAGKASPPRATETAPTPGTAPAPAPAPAPGTAPAQATVDTAEQVWGNYVRSFSSHAGPGGGDTSSLTGGPDVWPRHGTHTHAWSPVETADGEAFVEIGFVPRRMRQVTVYETFNPGAIKRVELVGDTKTIVLTSGASTRHPSGAAQTTFDVACTEQRIIAVRVWLDPRAVAGPNEIDAIGATPCW